MKKKLLLCAVLIFSGATQVSAQLSNLGDVIKKVPAHVEERLSEYDRIIPPRSLVKNVSYDTPMTIERYAVDMLEVQTLDRVYQLTYMPGGQLRTETRMDGLLNNEYRTIFNYDGVGEISSIIYQVWDGFNWQFDYREVYSYTTQGYLTSIVYELYNMGDWDYDGAYQFEYEYNGANVSVFKTNMSYDGETWEEYFRINYTYAGGNKPSEVTINVWDEDYLSYFPYEKWVVSNWGPDPFRPDFYFNPYRLERKISDVIINKTSDIDMFYPADFVYYAGYELTDGTYYYQANVYSIYDGSNRTEFTVEDWNGLIYEPNDRSLQQFDDCYGYRGVLYQDYVNPTGWQLDGGEIFVGEITPYNESCYVTAYNYYTNFDGGNPAGDWTRRWVINQFSNLSLNESELNNSLQVYPNPSTDEVTVNFTGDFTTDFELSVIGLDGRIHYTSKMSSSIHYIDLSQLPSGMYTLVLENENTVLTEKIVKR